MIGTSLAQNFTHVNGDIGVLIVGKEGILLENADSLGVSIRSRQPLKYKMAIIAVLDPMLSPEEILVGAIKQHAAMKLRSTLEFLLFAHIYCLGQWERGKVDVSLEACCIFKNWGEYCPCNRKEPWM